MEEKFNDVHKIVVNLITQQFLMPLFLCKCPHTPEEEKLRIKSKVLNFVIVILLIRIIYNNISFKSSLYKWTF